MKLSEAVKFYAENHFAVLPAVYGDKRPSVDWKEYQDEAPSEKQVKAWFKGKKEQNIAVICGEPSANLVVIDFDDMAVYPQFFNTQEIESATIVVKTGSGKRHVYLRSEKPAASFKIPQLKIEARAGLSLNYVLKYVGEVALSGLPIFSAASLVRIRLSML